ncbi:hypothetical protein [Candidatus Vampirococcus lugosii]|uniref:DUF2207 domain-containing protein n=1 Tax=Candidatus Vampirococcus lugosii TaxID=2789015 RepID=A0ABS5QMW9_9BACT|nr:hypothetical protein [Candidatus Vampirococcus lugosii]MBS8122512.1 hypothetical protein [Candidatus Vampirococcus lugosii]
MLNIKKNIKEIYNSKITEEEINKIYSFFENETNILDFNKNKNKYKQKSNIFGKLVLYIFLLWGVSILVLSQLEFKFTSLIGIITFFILFFYIILKSGSLKDDEKKIIDEENYMFVFFLEFMLKGIKFNFSDNFFDESIDEVKNKTNLIRDYTTIGFFGNSLEYDIDKNSKIKGIELETKNVNDSDNGPNLITVDKLYIRKMIFDKKIDYNYSEGIKIIKKITSKGILFMILQILFPIFFAILLLGTIFYITSMNYNELILNINSVIFWVSLNILILYIYLKYKIYNLKLEEKYNILIDDTYHREKFEKTQLFEIIEELIKLFNDKEFKFFIKNNEIYVMLNLKKDILNFGDDTNSFLKGCIDFYLMNNKILDFQNKINKISDFDK